MNRMNGTKNRAGWTVPFDFDVLLNSKFTFYIDTCWYLFILVLIV